MLSSQLFSDVNFWYPDKARFVFDGNKTVTITRAERYWRYNYRIDHKQKTVALGMYSDVSIEAARKAHHRARQLVRDGIDPSAVRHD